ncbi:MAG TPA: phosphoribosyltransferase family protein [Candidatus Moranbacteria bacterium]|nr:phosphoribosyltransferase family protein [Candidatus Moranbacteria bacterium]HRZ34116.1 phosphoribosyltransferase family protein [Candidatus Moranbacteria bacterium]
MGELSTVFSRSYKLILDILFPITCISCGKEDEWICQDCLSNIFIKNEHVCGICEKVITPDGKTCLACKKKSALGALITAVSYKNPTVAQAVHFYKYRFIPDLHIQLGNLMIKAIQKTDLPLPDIIIPIPLHPRRLRWRGFNQSALLAKHISLKLLPGTEILMDEKILIRKKYTFPQMKISSYQQRKENIKGAFSITNPEKIKSKTILLIDDIATTGSTIFECTRILKDSGAKEIYAAVIARQEIKKL